MSSQPRGVVVLAASTVAFTVCFAVWMLYGVLITYLTDQRYFAFSKTQIGWLIGAPVLTGALGRLPAGILADRYGGRMVLTALMLIAAVPLYLVGHAHTYGQLLAAGLGFGLTGASFAAGIAYVSPWFPPGRQGLVLGIFGMGTAGAALTNLVAPRLLAALGAGPDAWRALPRIYAAALVATAVLFFLAAPAPRRAEGGEASMAQRLAPLKLLRVWRFGVYYAFTFGSFVALSQWLVSYYVSVYGTSVALAGSLAAVFSLPSGVVRVVGGVLSDRIGARTVLYWTLGSSIALLALLLPPRMELQTPGPGVLAARPGVVTAVSEGEIRVGEDRYVLQQEVSESDARIRFGVHHDGEGFLFLPTASFRQIPAVAVGATVAKGQLLARGVTLVYFQANKWIFTTIVLLLGLVMGLASGAVFKHIPTYFPGQVGVVGGVVGVLGALGGFIEPIAFGALLGATGIWTTCWMLLAGFAIACLVWMHAVVRRLMHERAPDLMRQIDRAPPAPGAR